MNKNIKAYLDGYSKIMELFPNMDEGISKDWKEIGGDIYVSMDKYDTNELEKGTANKLKDNREVDVICKQK